MVETKTSRFGRKAMSLLLSGAMVVAFAPAVGAAVSEDVEAAYAASADVEDANGATGTAATYGSTSLTVKDGKATLPKSLIERAYANGAYDCNKSSYTSQTLLKATAAKGIKTGATIDISGWNQYVVKGKKGTEYTKLTEWGQLGSVKSGTLYKYLSETTNKNEPHVKINVTNYTCVDGKYVQNAYDSMQLWLTGTVQPEVGQYYWHATAESENDEVAFVYTKYENTMARTGKTSDGTEVYLWYTDNQLALENLTKDTDVYVGEEIDDSANYYIVAKAPQESAYAGSTVTVPLVAGSTIEFDYVTWTYDKQNYKNESTLPAMTYDGTDKSTLVTPNVYLKGVAIDSSKYTTYLTKDVNGTEVPVSEAVNAGATYKKHILTIEGEKIGYVTFSIVPASVKDAAYTGSYMVVDDGDSNKFGPTVGAATSGTNVTYVEYTGSKIDVTPTFYDEEAKFDEGIEYKTEKVTLGNKAKEVTVDSGLYTPEIQYKGTADAKYSPADEVLKPGTYQITIKQNMQAVGEANYVIDDITYYVVVTELKAGYMELKDVTYDETGKVLYSGTNFMPGATLYTENTAEGGTKVEVPDTAYTLVLQKSTTGQYDSKASGYTTVEAVNGPGYYRLTALDASKTDEYTVSDYIDFQVVEAAAEPEPEKEVVSQNVKIPSTFNKKVKAGGSVKLQTKGVLTSVEFVKVSGSKYLTVTKSGKIKVSKKAKKGKKYSIKVRAIAAAGETDTQIIKQDTEQKRYFITVK